VGTTETPFAGKPEDTTPLASEIEYLLTTVQRYFPTADTRIADSFSGLRVLPASTTKAFARSRDTQYLDDDGLITIYGGKLTAYRATAETVMRYVKKYTRTTKAIANTRHLPLELPPE
jgi:glycerol-3-phosphate dehydrogenase